VHVVAAPSRHPDVAELCVVADDRPGLLASIAAAITSNRLEVLAAQVYSRNVTPTATAGADPNGATHTPRVEAVDLFWVRDRNDGAVPVERTLPRLARDLDEVVTGRLSEDDVMRSRTASSSPWRERRSPAVTSEVVLDDRASPRHTVVEVYAKDRPGLLYTLAKTLHALGLSIVLSKINTEGTKVADVFYVNELDGGKVHGGDRARAVRETLLRAVTEEAPRDGRDAAAR
jgi:[protein-PII] uridylyltransferase